MAEESSSTICNINGKQFRLWTNPDASDLKKAPDLVRFTADGTCGAVYVWDYTCAMHTDMSMHLRLNDCYSCSDFLKGALRRGPDGKYRMVESHFLQSFKRPRLTNEEQNILINLLEQDWSWVNQYMEVTGWLESYRRAMGI
ncbi:MAG: hypothetical protein ACLP5H_17320 [Desulfomonilaceae bacterium]